MWNSFQHEFVATRGQCHKCKFTINPRLLPDKKEEGGGEAGDEKKKEGGGEAGDNGKKDSQVSADAAVAGGKKDSTNSGLDNADAKDAVDADDEDQPEPNEIVARCCERGWCDVDYCRDCFDELL